MLKGMIILFEYLFKSKLWHLSRFNLYSILNQRDKLFREFTGIKERFRSVIASEKK
jgi:hypothetical protein